MKHFKIILSTIKNSKFCFWIFLFALLLPNFVFAITEQVAVLVKISNIILPFAVYWFLMTLTRKPGKMLWSLSLLLFFNAFQLVLLYLFGAAPIAVDMFLNLVTTNSGEATELLGNILVPVLAIVIFYGLILTLASFSLNKNVVLDLSYRKRNRKYSIVLFVVSIILLIPTSLIDKTFLISSDIYPVNVFYNVGLAVNRDYKSNHYAETSKDFTFNAKTSHSKDEPEVYVFIIGETARAINFGIYGYERNTTPKLNAIKDELLIFKDALTQSNTTHKSVPMLLSAACAENYDCIYKQKSIITAFKECGYSTAFFSNQMYNRSFIDFFGEEADVCVYEKENVPDSANVSDDNLLNQLRKELSVNRSGKLKKFIVLHTYGSHFNYHERYPHESAIFSPDSVVSIKKENKEILRNAYDNSIYYTDSFIAKVIDMVRSTCKSSAVVYTSDHGEDIFDDDRNHFLHASPLPTIFQMYVPYIVWLSPKYKSEHPQIYNNLKSNIYKPISTNLATLHTILSLAGITGNEINENLSLTKRGFVAKPRFYLGDHNCPMPLNDIGLREEDITAIKKYHIQYP